MFKSYVFVGATIGALFALLGMWIGLGDTPQLVEPTSKPREPGLVFKVSSQCGLELAKELARYVEDRDIAFTVEMSGGYYFYEKHNTAGFAIGSSANLPESPRPDGVIDFIDIPANLKFHVRGTMVTMINGGQSPGDNYGYFDNRVPGTTGCWGNM